MDSFTQQIFTEHLVLTTRANTEHLLPATLCWAFLQVLAHLTLTTLLLGWYCYCPHITVKDTQAP